MKTPGFKMSRRRFIGGVSFAAAGAFTYAHFFEAERLQNSFFTVPLSNGTKPPLKLLHLSDLHASPVVSLNYIRRAVEVGLAWQPDLICVTGDFITQKFHNGPSYVAVLRLLSRAAPAFASLGNHDGGRWAAEEGGYTDSSWIRRLLADSDIQLLHNDSTIVRVAGHELNLVGCGDLWAGDLEAQRAFAKRRKGETILLSHNPDTKEHLNVFDWNLMLSGHTHGGQLRVPWLGATPFAPVQDKRFVSGLHRWNDRWIHVTKGIGSVFGVRINCPPEVSFLTLT
jgi:predicted MPP superfamily phosphohydrolase